MATQLTRTASGRAPGERAGAVASLFGRVVASLARRADVSVELALGDGRAWSRRVGRGGARVRCLAGSVLLTREGDPVDRVLVAGESFASERRGRLAALALAPARFVIAGDLR